MNKNWTRFLGLYDLIIAAAAFYTGLMMATSHSGIFTVSPQELSSSLPFDSWFIPGMIVILVFGMGNIIAAVFSFRKSNAPAVMPSIFMGWLMLGCIVFQVILLGEWYLGTVEALILGMIQLLLSRYLAGKSRRA